MDPSELVAEKAYEVVEEVEVCFHDKDGCHLDNMIKLQPGTELTYVGVNADDDGYIFKNSEGTEFCLHKNDLDYINFK